MAQCPKCGIGLEQGVKFCRNCGMPMRVTDEEAGTLPLPPETQRTPEMTRPTVPVTPTPTAPQQPGGPTYVPPMNYYPIPRPEAYVPPPVVGVQTKIRLGDWLSGGWQVYKENWLLMSLATLLGSFLGSVTLGILAGPLLMGLYRIALKTMRGERPEMGDLFNWEGRFLHAFLLALICALVYGGVASIGHNSSVGTLLGLVATPFLTMILALAMPFILERKVDVLAAINEVGRLVFSRDTLMWWIVGLVFSGLITLGFFGCGVGVFLTVPWIVSSAAVAYRDIYGIDDPNRTLH
ncbi:MAG TPA: zinc ribbon domain-containing protein [Blastocatellia bacterium]|nr:zinc ribbon domain-containing protein [Blastocatellia bacterium]